MQLWTGMCAGDVHLSIINFLITYLRSDKKLIRPIVHEAYSLFARRIIGALEAGFDPRGYPNAVSCWNLYSEAVDTCFGGASGKKNVEDMLSDRDLYRRVLLFMDKDLASLPSQSAQFNFLLTANRIRRFAYKNNAAIYADIQAFKTVSAIAIYITQNMH